MKAIHRKIVLILFTAWLTFWPASLRAAEPGSASPATPPSSAQSGTLTGHVSNAATGNLLEGAKVEVPQLGRSVLTDNTGRFQIAGVPAGTYEVVASYIGLDPVRSNVTVAAGQGATHEFALTNSIYLLQEFKVTGEREGAAIAITMQRNALNVKNVVAMDQFGNLPNLSASEVVIRLPGVASNLSGSGAGLADGFTVRGMGPGLNVVTVDGGLIATQNAKFRLQNINNLTGAMFEQAELVKGHTPDTGADSMGGTLNLKTRSALSLKEKRRITYSASVRMAPGFTEQIPLREAHRSHPFFDVVYQEVFDAFGGERNLGVTVSAFYSENVQGFFRSTRDFQNTVASPAYVWDYRTADNYNNRMHVSTNTKVDFRYSPATKFTLTTMVNDTRENRRRNYEARAFTSQSVGTTGTAGILPGYTDRITQVRASTASTIDISAPGQGFTNRLRGVDFGAEHDFGRLRLDYNARYNYTNINQNTGNTGSLTMRITNVGWILDRSQSDLYPRFIQTEGPDITDFANYRPVANGLSTTKTEADLSISEVRGNARYELPTPVPVYLKAGFQLREQFAKDTSSPRRWNYIGTSPLPADPTIVSFDSLKTGRKLPQWDGGAFMNESADVTPSTPALWNEDRYFHESGIYTGSDFITEVVTAGYLMAQGKLGREGVFSHTSYIAGVRTEKTDNKSIGYVRSRTPSTAAQQLADPVGSAQRDYGNNKRQIKGSYTKSFPSLHLTHEVTPQLKARLSWSTSFGRPSMTTALPNETPSETNQTLTVNNPALRPQMAKNWDAALEYYFEPVGNLSAGWFHKEIRDFIVSGINSGTIGSGADNGYGGEYSGFTRLTSANAGTAVVQGWEFVYQQQFTFLPGLLKGLSLSANYTVLDTHGDFGGTTTLSSGQVAGFTPRTANLNLSWRYHGFSARFIANYNSAGLTTYSATSAALNIYRDKRTTMTFGAAYQLRPSLSLTLDVDNAFNVPQVAYKGIPDRMQRTVLNGVTFTAGISGRF